MKIPDATLAKYHGSRANYLKSLEATLQQEQSRSSGKQDQALAKAQNEIAKIQKQIEDNQ